MNARSALLALFMALTVVLASTTVYESGVRITLTSTSTSRSTLTQTTTETTTTTSTTVSTTSLVSISTVTATKSAAFALSVQVDRPDYTTNQSILVSGSVSPPPLGAYVNLIVASPSGLAITATTPVSTANGSYSYTLVAGGSALWVAGVYRVTVICVAFGATQTATTQFAYVLPE